MAGSSSAGATLLRVLLPLLVVGGAIAVAMQLTATPPRAKRQAKPRSARLVEVQPVAISEQRARVHAMGSVRPARTLEVRPRVGGQVSRLGKEFIPGGRFKAGRMLAQIDPADFDLAIRQRQSDVTRAQGELRIEHGRQSVASREFKLLGDEGAQQELVLRKPQLATAQANVEAAQAALEQAKLDRKRTTIVAPFNAVVESRNVEVGSQVTPSSLLGRLVGTDAYWVEVSVPVSQLRWIDVPQDSQEEGSVVRVCNEGAWGPGVCREGRVLRLASGLEEQGRMARLLVELRDPLSLDKQSAGQPRLILGSYVRIEIEGSQQMQVAVIERGALRDGDHVWIANADDKLEIRAVQVAFRDREHVHVVGGLEAGERVITTKVSGAVQGMPIRTGSQQTKPQQADKRTPQPRTDSDG